MVLPNVPETVSRRGELDSNTFHDDLSLKRQRFCYIQRTQQAILLLHSFSFQNGVTQCQNLINASFCYWRKMLIRTWTVSRGKKKSYSVSCTVRVQVLYWSRWGLIRDLKHREHVEYVDLSMASKPVFCIIVIYLGSLCFAMCFIDNFSILGPSHSISTSPIVEILWMGYEIHFWGGWSISNLWSVYISEGGGGRGWKKCGLFLRGWRKKSRRGGIMSALWPFFLLGGG